MKRYIVALLVLLFLMQITLVSSYAVTIGKNTMNDPFPRDEFKYTDNGYEWLKPMPKLWSGEYDGSHGPTHVRRKYAIKIEDFDLKNRTFTGVGFVDRLKNDAHPELQVRGSYRIEGTYDPETRTLTFQGTDFINYIPDFSFALFTVSVSDDYKVMSGTTDSWDGSRADLKAATSETYTSYMNGFNYDENKMEPELASECAELAMLAYGESKGEATGYYVSAKGNKGQKESLKKKLISEGFDKNNISGELISSIKEGDLTDSIHWSYAHRKLEDGTGLVYVILRGTTNEEWYGDFNVTGENETYNQELDGRHYSFENAAAALLNDLDTKVGGKYDNVRYVVTGHSRGAAVANIVAKMLTDEKEGNSSIAGVYGYTFATPTVIRLEHSGNYTNIFNFCLDDDFVTYMPLMDSNWQYSRYGTTYYSSAFRLYQNNKYFRNIMNYYRKYDSKYNGLSYKNKGAYNIANRVETKCRSVEEYYAKQYWNNKYSWYNYFYNFFASLMYKGVDGIKENKEYIMVDPFQTITSRFIAGGAGYCFDHYEIAAYLGTHDPANYYALAKCIEVDPDVISTSSDLRNELAEIFPYDENRISGSAKSRKAQSRSISLNAENDTDENNEESAEETPALEGDAAVLYEFVDSHNNAELLGWNKEDPSTWEGVTFTDDKITSIDISGKGLEGVLDVSGLDSLETIDCSFNLLTDLIIGDAPIKDLSCEGNLLDITEDSDLMKKVKELTDNGGFASSVYPQGIAEDPVFNSSEVTTLEKLCTKSNLSLLGWELGKPETYKGIHWEYTAGEYHVTGIDLTGLGLSGAVDLTNMKYLKSVQLSDNSITSLDVSGCTKLEVIDASNNRLTHLGHKDDNMLNTLVCDHNYITDDEYYSLLALEDSREIAVSIRPQYISAGEDSFDQDDLSNIKALMQNCDTDIDWSTPGENDVLSWRKAGEKYRLAGIDLSGQNISGEVDLNTFTYLETVSLKNTDITSVKIPQSVTYFEDEAFSGCGELKDLYVCDTWNKMGTDVFKGCDKLTIHCTRKSFASFIAEALGIGFDEVVGLDYIVIEGDAEVRAYKGGEIMLGENKVVAYYTDETSKEITQYSTEDFDNQKIGKQLVKFSYTDEDYTRVVEHDVYVYGLTEEGFVYSYEGDDISIRGYIGKEEEITVPSSIEDKNVVSIDNNAFRGNTDITKISIPETVKYIRSEAFMDCSKLKTVNVTDGLQSIDDSAFSNCTSLDEFIMPDTINNLGSYVFENCTSLRHVKINDTRRNITDGLFYNCTSLEEVDMPDTVEYIRYKAFYGCSSLKNPDFPDGLKSIESYAFTGSGLEKIVIPDSVTDVGWYAFSECRDLTEAVLGSGCDFINEGLFYNCISLTKVVIPDIVTEISYDAFQGCSSLEKITLPAALKYIDMYAFKDTGLREIKYNGTVSSWKSVQISSEGTDVFRSIDIYCIKDRKYSVAPNRRKVPRTIIKKIYPRRKALKVKWKAISGAKFYKVQYSRKKNFKGARTIIVKGRTYRVIKKLKARKRYYVRIKVCKSVRGQKFYSAWSKVGIKKTK